MSVFHFRSAFNRPAMHKNTINFEKASLENILRSFYVNKLRYVQRFISYRNHIKFLKRIKTIEDLKSVTALLRPGKLHNIENSEYLIKSGKPHE